MRGVTNLLITLLVVTFTMQDLLNTACNVGCRKENYDAGFYVQKGFCDQLTFLKFHFNKKECACITFLEFEDVTAKSIPKALHYGSGGGSSEEMGSEPAPQEQHSTPVYFPRFNFGSQ